MNKMVSHPASFRDTSGFIFKIDNIVYRAITQSYRKDYDYLISSDLYSKLINNELIVSHHEVNDFINEDLNIYKVLKPDLIPFISYPYEWSFNQLKHAALLTLRIQKLSMDHGMVLKDASVYNVQYIGSKPIFIDLLSFEIMQNDRPWVAYHQFCKHFLAPLFLMAKVHYGLKGLFINNIDGIPLDLASEILPFQTWFNFGALTHIHLHSLVGGKISSNANSTQYSLKKSSLYNIVDTLESVIKNLDLKKSKKQLHWVKYSVENTYSDISQTQKQKQVIKWLEKISNPIVIDLGCNTGVYSILASKIAQYVIAIDSDFYSIEYFFKQLLTSEIQNILPLHIDLFNPSPGIGWKNIERDSFHQRIKGKCTLCLALVHHFYFVNNLSFELIAEYLHNLAPILIVEFIDQLDSQVQILSRNKSALLVSYMKLNFENAFSVYFNIVEIKKIEGMDRWLYFMEANS